MRQPMPKPPIRIIEPKRPPIRITEEYVTEKIEAYNIAIQALEIHEPASDCDWRLAKMLRTRLKNKLNREIQTWCDKNMDKAKERPK